MRILHTADWHLGRSLKQQRLIEDQRHALEGLLDLCADEEVDVLIIAGDVYDRAQPPAEAVELLDEVLGRAVLDMELQVVMIAGNHDSPERLGYCAGLLGRQGLHVHGQVESEPRIVTLADEHGPVHVCLLPYVEPAWARAAFPEADIPDHDGAVAAAVASIRGALPAGERALLVAHLFAVGGMTSESERPLWVGGAGCVAAERFEGFSYTALGHLHRPQRVGKAEQLRYAGSLLKYSFDEHEHDKGVLLVDIDAAGNAKVEERKLSLLRDLRRVEGEFEALLKAGEADPGREDYLEITLTNRELILDAKARLAKVYPHVLSVQRQERIVAASSAGSLPGDHRKADVLELFAQFYESRTEQGLDEPRRAILRELLAAADVQERSE